MQRLARQRVLASVLTAAALSWTLALWEWGEPRKVIWVIAAWLTMSLANFFVSFWLARRVGTGLRGERARRGQHPGVADPRARHRLAAAGLDLRAVLLRAGDGLAQELRADARRVLPRGVDWRRALGRDRVGLVLGFVVLGVFCYWVSDARAGVIEERLAERNRQNEQLRQAQDELQNWHSNAVATEKLTSLGMLASGMAHEINTP
jgi:C4-dicarboxylate-specific signal transduction histidine kinase